MKKIRIFAVLSLTLCALAALALAGCGKPKLSAPVGLSVQPDTLVLSWEAVPTAKSYVVNIGGDERETDKTFTDLTSLEAGTYSLRVKAVGDGETYADSPWSEPLEFVREQENGLVYSLYNNNLEYEVVGAGTVSGEVEIPETYRLSARPFPTTAALQRSRSEKTSAPSARAHSITVLS